jgi:hypothetical protein
MAENIEELSAFGTPGPVMVPCRLHDIFFRKGFFSEGRPVINGRMAFRLGLCEFLHCFIFRKSSFFGGRPVIKGRIAFGVGLCEFLAFGLGASTPNLVEVVVLKRDPLFLPVDHFERVSIDKPTVILIPLLNNVLGELRENNL